MKSCTLICVVLTASFIATRLPAAEEIAVFSEHTGGINALALSSDGKYIATAAADKVSYVVEAATLKVIKKYGPHGAELTGVAMQRDNSVIVSGVLDKARGIGLHHYSWETGQRRQYAIPVSLYGVKLAPNEKEVAAGLNDARANIYALADGSIKTIQQADPDRACRCVAFTRDGKILLMGSGPHIAVCELEREPPSGRRFKSDGEGLTTSISLFPDDSHLVTSHANGVVRLWKFEGRMQLWRVPAHEGEAHSAAVSPNAKLFASGGADKKVRVWDIAKQQMIDEFTADTPVLSVLFVSDAVVAAGSADGKVRLLSLDAMTRPVQEPMPEPTPESLPKPEAPSVAISPAKRLKPPAEREVADAIEIVKEVFDDEYGAAKRPADKQELAETLAKHAIAEGVDPIESFALLSEAIRLYGETGAVKPAVKAADMLAERFDLPPKFHLEYLTRLASVAAVKDQVHVADAALRFAEDACRVEHFDTSQELGRIAYRAAVAGRAAGIQKSINEFAGRLKHERARYEAYEVAVQTLKGNPGDAAANLAAGRYLCFAKGDWQRGINHLALGADSELKTIAQKELSIGDSGAELLALAELWQKGAETADAGDRAHYLASAVYWYERAEPKVSALFKLKVEQAIKKIGSLPVKRQ